ncbi:hypothetical protein GCM10010381_43320 [Streptomyces xantholiticus]|nr:hypothetical protein GCM10010381_43320 [Streptomyces xantholiticus]
MREVGERLDAVLDLRLEDGGADPVRGDVLDVERLDVLAHRAQGGPRRGEVGAFAGERVVPVRGGRGGGGHVGYRGVRGHGLPPAELRDHDMADRPVSVRTAALLEGVRRRRGRPRSSPGQARECSGAGERARTDFRAGVIPVGDAPCRK